MEILEPTEKLKNRDLIIIPFIILKPKSYKKNRGPENRLINNQT